MMPMRPSADVIERRLAHQRRLLVELDALDNRTAKALSDSAIVRAATERMIQAVVDLALDINAHVASTVLGQAPGTGRESFDLMAEAGVVTHRLADQLKPAVGLRNVLVHLYADIDMEIVAESIDDFLMGFRDYVRSVARWLVK